MPAWFAVTRQDRPTERYGESYDTFDVINKGQSRTTIKEYDSDIQDQHRCIAEDKLPITNASVNHVPDKTDTCTQLCNA